MKRSIFFFLIFSFFSSYLFCQDTDSKDINENELFPKLLILNQNNIFKISYQFPDSTSVSPSELKELINIPSNQTLLKQCRQLTITSILLRGLTLASTGCIFAYILNDNLAYSNIMVPTLSGICVASFVANLFTVQTTNVKFLYMIDNYNLQILGIPAVKNGSRK